MKLLLQRVMCASVDVAGQTVASIGQGILVFVAFEQKDTLSDIKKMADNYIRMPQYVLLYPNNLMCANFC